MEDGGDQIGWVWGWSGVGWWSVVARSTTLSKRENKIVVSRTSSILGGSRTRSILGGDNLDGSADELPAVTMMATLSLSLSLSLSTFLVCKIFLEGKTTIKLILQVRGGILRSKCKIFLV